MRRRKTAVSYVALGIALCTVACGSAATQSSLGTQTSSPTATLAGVILTSGPTGFVLIPDDVAHTGPTSLEIQAVSDARPDAKEALSADGFMTGYRRLWELPLDPGESAADITKLSITLYKFGMPSGATAYASRFSQRIGEVAFPIPSLPNVTGLHEAPPNVGVRTVITKGAYLVRIEVDGRKSTEASLIAAAQLQSSLLP